MRCALAEADIYLNANKQMNVLITIGPTQEPLDAMRILSNRSTGTLGTQLALSLASEGHFVIIFRGTGATAETSELIKLGVQIIPFTTTEDLRCLFEKISKTEQIDTVFHVAAVSDFYLPSAGSGKIPTSDGALTLTFEPTPKLLPLLRGWFPTAQIFGWKFEASRDKENAIALGRNQIANNQTDACVLNGPSYGEGFGFLEKEKEIHHLSNGKCLCNFLTELLTPRSGVKGRVGDFSSPLG